MIKPRPTRRLIPITTLPRDVEEGLLAVLPDLVAVPALVWPEMTSVVHRALQAGARPPLRYLGAGMTAVVLGDASGTKAFKVGRHPDSEVNRQTIETEAEYLADCNKTAALFGRVVKFIKFYPAPLLVIV